MKFFFRLGLFSLLALVVLTFFIPWEWSFLMDDAQYGRWMPQIQNLPKAFMQEIHNYWIQGRFYPVKYLANLVKWMYLPQNPILFHWINFFVLFISAFIIILSITDSVKEKTLRKHWIFFSLGFLTLQRPILDIIALNTIGETWVVLFLAVGMYFFIKNSPLYRLFFILSCLSKEPAVMALLASLVTHLYRGLVHRKDRMQSLRDAFIDLVLSCTLLFIIIKAKNSGHYLEQYQVFSLQGLINLPLIFAKACFGLLPVWYVLFAKRKIFFKNFKEIRFQTFTLFSLIFIFGYLFLTASRNTAGYLIIPPSFVLYALTLEWLVQSDKELKLQKKTLVVFTFLFISCLTISLVRFEYFVRGINEPSLALKNLTLDTKPRLILVNGLEAAGAAEYLATTLKHPVHAYLYDEEALTRIKNFSGEIVLFELTAYFGGYPPQTISQVEKAVGGWTQITDKGVYREFRGQKH